MLFKRTSLYALGSLFFLLSACGARAPAEKTLLPGNDIGCYDKLGERVSRYFDGAIDESEWQATFDCVNDQLTFFKKYVRGNAPGGNYDRADIGALVRKFLIVNRPVSDLFIGTIFDIKASVFGGSPTVITEAEIDEFVKLSEVLRRETTALLPRLQAKHRSTTSDNLLALSDGLEIFGVRLSEYLKTLKGTVDVPKETFIPFVREVLALSGGDAGLVDEYGDFIRNLKVVVSAGSSNVIEAKSWPTLIREGAAFGGLLFAYRNLDSASDDEETKDRFMIDLGRRMQTTINRVISVHGTGIPLETFNPVIDTIPFEGFSLEQRAAVKFDLGQIIFRALGGGVPGWLTPAAVATVFDLYEDGMRQQIHLKKIYKNLPPMPKAKDFEVEARHYGGVAFTGHEREEVNSLINIAKTYVGLFDEDSGEMLFTDEIRESRTRNHMIRMSWFKLLIEHVISVYATGPTTSAGRKTARKEDLAELSTDFHEILLNWNMALRGDSPLDVAEKRFREANLFMPISNGDAYMDDIEATYYLAFLFSSGSFSSTIFNGVTRDARGWPVCPLDKTDIVHQPAMTAACFRNAYFGHPEVFWKSFPALQKAYAEMSNQQKASLAHSMEVASRRGGYTEDPIGKFDIDSFAGLPHYVEKIIDRFDVNKNGVLDKREILDRAYPIFKQTLQKAAPEAKSDFLLKGILTYIVRYGKKPNSTLALLAWCARMPLTKVVADRVSLYRVVALLSETLEPTKSNSGSNWPGFHESLFPTVIPE
jgi:hypothetical protein